MATTPIVYGLFDEAVAELARIEAEVDARHNDDFLDGAFAYSKATKLFDEISETWRDAEHGFAIREFDH